MIRRRSDYSKQKWVDIKIAQKLDYSVFMATSEVGGKDSSGEYEFRKDDDGKLIEDEFGNQDVGLFRLRNGYHPYFVAAWFNSLIGKQLVEQRSTWGINPFLGL